MKKGNKRKSEIQNVTKELILEKGYSAVTMSDISQKLNLSVGGLYYHYHSIEEIFLDLMASETTDIWNLFEEVSDSDALLEALQKYFESEKQELLNFDHSLNAILYDYYFSFPLAVRKKKLQADFDNVSRKISSVLADFIFSETERNQISNRILVCLHGLNIVAMGQDLTADVIDQEFQGVIDMVQKSLTNNKL